MLEPTDSELIIANLLIMLWAIVFIVATKYVKEKKTESVDRVNNTVDVKYDKMLLLAIVSIALTVYKIASIGLLQLLSRDTSVGENPTFSSSSQILNHSINAFVVLCFAFSCLLNRKEKHSILLFVSTVCMLICCFPTGTARYNAATVYFAAIIFLFQKFIKGRRFTYIFILGLIIVFPMLDAFRRNSFLDADIFGYAAEVFADYSNYFTEGHYDAYAMLIRTVKYVSSHGFTWGYQLIGDIFFFVPRTVWASKPIGTGAMIMNDLNADFTNVSAPLPAEGYINFGILGLLLFAFVLGFVVKKFDNYYWSNYNYVLIGQYRALDVFYPYFISLLFFMLRGDLMSSTAYTAAYFIVCIFISKFYFGTTHKPLLTYD